MLRILTGTAWAGSDLLLLARILGTNGLPITPASIASIAWTLTDLTAGTAAGSGSFAVAGTVQNDLVTNDPRWSWDSPDAPGADGLAGYNFLATLPAANVPVSAPGATADRYQLDVHLTDTSGGNFRVSWQFTPVTVFG